MNFPLSPYRKAGNLIFVSGQIGMQDGQLVQGGIESETEQTIENIKSILQKENLSLNNVIVAEVFLSSFATDYAPMNEVYARLFSEPYPARICVGVKELPAGARVEIKVTAAV